MGLKLLDALLCGIVHRVEKLSPADTVTKNYHARVSNGSTSSDDWSTAHAKLLRELPEMFHFERLGGDEGGRKRLVLPNYYGSIW